MCTEKKVYANVFFQLYQSAGECRDYLLSFLGSSTLGPWHLGGILNKQIIISQVGDYSLIRVNLG